MLRSARLFVIAFAVTITGFFVMPDRPANKPAEMIVGISLADAQQRKKRSLFNIIFGRKWTWSRSRDRNRSRRPSTHRSGVSRTAVTPKVDKLEDAKIVLVVGDFFAGGMADGLQALLADSASLRVVDASNGLSGLVREDVVNWPERIAELVERHKPVYIVAMVGANDRQLIREGGQKLKTRSPEWDVAYKARIAEFGKALKATGLPYSWAGLPPIRLKSLTQDYLVFNEWYTAETKAPQGKFFDVWDGFADEDGNYSRSGPDVSGQIVLLRSKDGINLTKAGRRRLAFYVEADIRKATNDPSSVLSAAGTQDVWPETPQYDPEKSGRTLVVNLNDPAIDGVSGLAGEKVDFSANVLAKRSKQSTVEQAATSAPRTAQQRADNYSWPPQPYAPQPAASSVTASAAQ